MKKHPNARECVIGAALFQSGAPNSGHCEKRTLNCVNGLQVHHPLAERLGSLVPRPKLRANRAAHALTLPLPPEPQRYRKAQLHLLLVRLSALAGSAEHRMTAANRSCRSDMSSRWGVGQPRQHPRGGLRQLVQEAHGVTAFLEFAKDLGDQLRPDDDLTPFMIWRAPPSDRSADSN